MSAYAVLAFAYYGWGGLLLGIMRAKLDAPDRIFTQIWLGWSGSIFVLLLAHFVSALSAVVSALLFGSGVLLGIWWRLRERRPSAVAGLRIYVYWIALIPVSIWLASWAMLPPQIYDSGLYHFASLRWINEYAIVPGLSNLHVRFGFNQSIFLYAASLNFHPYLRHGHNIANSFLILVLVAECLYHIVRWRGSKDGAGRADMFFAVIFLVVSMVITVASSISSPAPDTALMILEFVLMWQFVRLLEERSTAPVALSRLGVIVILAGAIITAKLSALLFVVVLVMLSLIFMRPYAQAKKTVDSRPVTLALVLVALLLSSWVVRGYILSGYPLYPSAVGGIGLEWAIPVEKVKYDYLAIYDFARLPGKGDFHATLETWDWVRPWVQAQMRQTVNVVYPLAVACGALLITGVTLLVPAGRTLIGKHKHLLLLPVPVLSGLLFWFFTAPDVRFIQGLFYLLPAAAVYPILRIMPLKGAEAAVWIVIIALVVNGGISSWLLRRASSVARVPGVGYCAVPQITYSTKTTDFGLQVLVPEAAGMCWDAPVPCVNEFNKNLRLRGAGLQSGFTVRP